MVDSKENYKFGLEVKGLNKHTVKPNKYNTNKGNAHISVF